MFDFLCKGVKTKRYEFGAAHNFYIENSDWQSGILMIIPLRAHRENNIKS